jgi:hypothetical protein
MRAPAPFAAELAGAELACATFSFAAAVVFAAGFALAGAGCVGDCFVGAFVFELRAVAMRRD